jgi:hypothetical protein
MIGTKFLKTKALAIYSTLFLALVICNIIYGQQTKIKGENKMKANVIEVVIMKVKEGISDDEFLKAAKNIDETVSKFPGFISRELAKDEKGNWIDLVHWTDLASAQKAADEVMKSPHL